MSFEQGVFPSMKKTMRQLTAIAGAACLALAGFTAQAEPTTYNASDLADFSGPYADIYKQLDHCKKSALKWWNAEVGSDLDVQLNLKTYDTRYDVAQIASIWPGILASLKPVASLGVGGPDVAALQERLPDDKVIDFLGTAAYGYAWHSNAWLFNLRATYGHEAAAFLNWYKANKREGDGPMKIGIVSSEASPAYVDIDKGVQQFAKDNPDEFEVVGVIYSEVQPIDLTQQINQLVRKGAEVITIQTNTAMVVAAQRALEALGKTDIPLFLSSHNGLAESGAAAGGLEQMEGNYEGYGYAIAVTDESPLGQFVQMLRDKYGLTGDLNASCKMGIGQFLALARTLENAVKDNPGKTLVSEDLRNALFAHPITSDQTFGLLSDLAYSEEAPFPQTGLKINIGTVKDGKYVLVTNEAEVPEVNKWD